MKSWLILGTCLATLAACDGNGKATPNDNSTGPAPTTDGKLVFSDDFEDGTFRPEWERGQGEDGVGKWRVEDGAVIGVDIKNDPLWLKQELPDKARIEFDVTALSSVGDIKVEVFGDGVKHESGYILIFGGWKNTLDVIARLDEHGKDRKARNTHGVVPGHTYNMAIERTDSTLHWFVNGKHFMTYEDPQALTGDGHRHFAFNIWSAPVKFDNVKVYDLAK
ncbi:hypothetical protein FIV42_27370 [Persicimonas caeni]|uniref:DUF1080 domain-containing protein n=1 Tax=Persicimonas caeni TaxID=2292766 RepID=A0A4Y6Q178_PERCE|nr:hypothetical protein [Persicimonas caeni]QDG54331.1 hypothetical protein FIV42_27370 [Persicimonas caeni]QED35552.1 hypothetical protein FRD00_27365 [Persicimonas caeni]